MSPFFFFTTTMGDEKGDTDSLMTLASCRVRTWPLFIGRFVSQFDVMLDFCCMAKVKIVLRKEVRIKVQFLSYPGFPLFRKW